MSAAIGRIYALVRRAGDPAGETLGRERSHAPRDSVDSSY